VPPAGEHPDDPEARAHLVGAAAAHADLGTVQAGPLVLARLEEHALEQDAVGLLLAAARVLGGADVAQAAGERVALGLELGEPEQARPRAGALGRRGRGDVREGGDDRVAQLALELRDLVAQRPPRGALVGDQRREHIEARPGLDASQHHRSA